MPRFVLDVTGWPSPFRNCGGGGLQDAWNNPSLELPTTPQVHNFVLVRQLGVDATLGTFGTMKREGTNGLVPSTTIKIIL